MRVSLAIYEQGEFPHCLANIMVGAAQVLKSKFVEAAKVKNELEAEFQTKSSQEAVQIFAEFRFFLLGV